MDKDKGGEAVMGDLVYYSKGLWFFPQGATKNLSKNVTWSDLLFRKITLGSVKRGLEKDKTS